MEKKGNSINEVKKKLLAVLLVIVPLILLVLPADFFDYGQSICLSVLLLNTECYGCGMTRAIMHLLHADFSGAWGFNKLSLIVFPLLFMLYIKMSAFYLFDRNIMKWF